jgi:hypothetical protein
MVKPINQKMKAPVVKREGSLIFTQSSGERFAGTIRFTTGGGE